MKPLVIPIFIAHQGCPHRCIFCDQFTITGESDGEEQPVTPEKVKDTIEQWLGRPRRKNKNGVQVAFYGGSFTGLPIKRQRELLGSVSSYIERGLVDLIRISTRPDYVDDRISALLQEHYVSIVELGIQSLAQDVLDASARGYSAEQAENAIRLLQQKGFTVGVQLMCGLPGDTTGKLMTTVERVAALSPDFVRIYPALVLKGSGLDKLYRDGNYQPLSLEKGVALCCRMKTIFDQHNIRVVRMGLQSSEELADRVVAGPYHAAFGELVISRALFKKTRKILRQKETSTGRHLSIAAADESVFRGPKNINMKRLTALELLNDIEIVLHEGQARNSISLY